MAVWLTNSILLYADGHDSDPYLSPALGDFSNGFSPTLLTSGTRDLFLSNTVLFHRALRRSGIEAELHVWEAMPHGAFFGAARGQGSLRGTEPVHPAQARCVVGQSQPRSMTNRLSAR